MNGILRIANRYGVIWMALALMACGGCAKSENPNSPNTTSTPAETAASAATPAAPVGIEPVTPKDEKILDTVAEDVADAEAKQPAAPEEKPAATETPAPAPTEAPAPPQASAAPATEAPAATGAAAAPAPVKLVSATEDKQPTNIEVQPGDCPQWMGSPIRNNVSDAKHIPSEWEVGDFDKKTGDWVADSGQNIKWVARLGSQTYGNPVIANGQVYVGTNNSGGWLKRYPSDVDLGVLLCFKESDGSFLWQHSSEKLPTGRVHDWPLQGICCSPLVEGKRLWFVTSRGEVRCLDAEGFHDDENDGPYKAEPNDNKDEADVIWNLDMMADLKISQHNMCSCSVTSVGDLLFVCTSNGVDESHINLPAPSAPSFICLDKNTGELLWQDDSPGNNILHGQWSSPTYAVLGGVPQVMFAGGDAWLYSFRGDKSENGKPELLWKFDCNPKETKYILGGRGTRNEIIATPVAYKGRVYIAVGQDPEHGEGIGHLWCIDPTKRGDISPELAFKVDDLKTPIPAKRLQNVVAEEGEVARPNPNSGMIWHYSTYDSNDNGKIEFEETMHRTIGSVAIKDDLIFIADFSGLFHCVDAETGKPHWTHDMLAASWGSPLIVDDKVYIGDEDGDVTVVKLSPELEVLSEINMANSIYTTPVVANGVLYICNKTHLFAIGSGENVEQAAAGGGN